MRPEICIDPGHGGKANGAISPKGILEKDLNLSVARKLRLVLEDMGLHVVMTRESDLDLDLIERVRIAQENNCNLFLSIHHNALPDGRNPSEEEGFSCHYFYEHSFKLAQHLALSLQDTQRQKCAGIYQQNLHVLRENPNMQSVLLELGYLIHPLESELISAQEFQDKTAQVLANSIQDFYKNGAVRIVK